MEAAKKVVRWVEKSAQYKSRELVVVAVNQQNGKKVRVWRKIA